MVRFYVIVLQLAFLKVLSGFDYIGIANVVIVIRALGRFAFSGNGCIFGYNFLIRRIGRRSVAFSAIYRSG